MATENKNLSHYDKDAIPNASHLRVGIVTSEWNAEVTHGLRKGAVETLLNCKVLAENIYHLSVPGSFELVQGARKMLSTSVDAVIVIGCVIQGETRHFDFVCSGVTQGISHLNAEQDIPVIFCVLTDETRQQSLDRSGGKHGNKGVEAAITAIQMCENKIRSEKEIRSITL